MASAAELNANSFLAAAGDAGRILDAIFKTAAISEILTIVNMVILAMGAVWLTYNILAATVQSAWDGEFAGKRFHTLWMPIRFCIGFAALLPMIDGWGAAQVVLYQVAKMGAGAANIAVAGAAPKLLKNEIITTGFDRSGMATQLFNTLLCRARVSILAQQAGELESAAGGGGTNWTEYFGIERCGGQPVVPAGDLQAAHTSATQAMITNLTPLAGRVAAGQEGRGPVVPAEEVRAAIIKAAEAYEVSVAEAARSLASSKVSALNAEQANGSWLTFGFQSVKSAKAQSDLNSAAGGGAQLTANTNTSSAGQEAATYSGSIMESEGLSGTQAAGSGSGSGAGSGESLWAMLKKVKDNPSLLLKILFGNAKAAALTAGGGLVQSLAAFGASLIGMGIAGIGVILIALTALAFTSVLGAGAMPLALYVSGLAMSIIVPMILMGITLAVYVPMIPALFWTLGVVAWLLVVAECIFLAPVWALVHLEAEGEGMGQRTEKGYAMLLDLLLRPLALVFGFAIATAVLNAAWALFTAGVGGVLDVADTWSLIKFFMWLGMVFIIVTIAVQLVGTVYRKALDLPDQIVTWIGSSVASYMGDHSTKDPNDSLRGAGRGGGRMPTKGSQGGGDTPAPAAPSPSAPASGGGK
ncbi:MAG: DotA/TraY family protein [Burkholderiales bacterium]|nr:DotA/TraY family protein [Burkholderiales bacterium]